MLNCVQWPRAVPNSILCRTETLAQDIWTAVCLEEAQALSLFRSCRNRTTAQREKETILFGAPLLPRRIIRTHLIENTCGHRWKPVSEFGACGRLCFSSFACLAAKRRRRSLHKTPQVRTGAQAAFAVHSSAVAAACLESEGTGCLLSKLHLNVV